MYLHLRTVYRHSDQRRNFRGPDEEDSVGHNAHLGDAAEEEADIQRDVQRLPPPADHGLHQPQGGAHSPATSIT